MFSLVLTRAAIKHDPCSSAGKKRKIVDDVGKAEQSGSSRASPTIVAKVSLLACLTMLLLNVLVIG